MYKVLVVDDEVWMCEGLKKIISKLELDFTVTDTAADGGQALDTLENEAIDVVITDIHMPRMNGIQLLEKMQERGYKQPIIIVSAYDEFEYARSAMRLGAVDYLVKPIKNDELSLVLSNLHELFSRDEQVSKKEVSAKDFQDLNGGVELVRSVLGTIEDSYMEDLSLSQIADQTGFNSSYLSRLFKMETGKGFVQYLREVRMSHACQLLKETGMTNVEVAKRVGFWDEKHFRRTFKKDFDMTPGEFRDLHQSKK